MTLIRKPFRRLLDTTRATLLRRGGGRRPTGSILILVVALLVLLLLIGTAFLSTSRSERYAAIQDAANTQADLLLQGVENALAGQIVGKSFAGSSATAATFRQAATALAQYNDFESPQADLYLASRLPITLTNGVPAPSGTAPGWANVSLPPGALTDGNALVAYQIPPVTAGGQPTVLIQNYSSSASYNAGDVVVLPGQTPALYYAALSSTPGTPSPTNPAGWAVVNPKQVFTFTLGVTADGQSGLAIFNTVAGQYLTPPAAGKMTAYSATAYYYPGADTDGDGIADSLAFRLPTGQIDGVSYTVAVRVVDGNSAVNASTAWTNATDTDYTNATNYQYLGLFRPNVGLNELLTSTGEMAKLNAYRFNSATLLVKSPFDDTGTARADMSFLTQADAFENQLVRRPLNPGYNTGTAVPYQWVGQSATASLANRFCLKSAALTPTALESTYLPVELTGNANLRNAPYSATAYKTWYGDNFTFPTSGSSPNPTATPMPLRSVLVGSNPVSNAVYGHYNARGPWATGALYNFGDWVTFNNGSGSPLSFVCIQPHTAGSSAGATLDATSATQMATNAYSAYTTLPPPATAHLAQDQYWAFVPWTNVPTKVSASAGTFGQLWAAYWNVMWDHPSIVAGTASTFPGFPQPMFGYPRYAGDTLNNQVANQNTYLATAATAPARMFRSPIRDPNAAPGTTTAQYLTPGQTMMLRSALAALNLTSLRAASGTTVYGNGSRPNGLDDVISRQIAIPADPADGSSKAYNVMLFGATKQPYIDEVYVNMAADGTVKSIGIELCNPYPATMTLTHWQIARLNRSTSATPPYSTGSTVSMTVSGTSAASGTANYVIPASTTIPPASPTTCGKLLLYDYVTGGTVPTWVPTSPTSTAGGENAAQVTGLALVGPKDPNNGQEIVILRPRSATPTATPVTSADPVNPFNEAYVADLCPVDQIDMTGLVPPDADVTYDYRRGTTVDGSNAWNFVYPGPYSALPGGTTNVYTFRHAGWVQGAATAQPNFGTEKGPYPISTTSVTSSPTTGQPTFPSNTTGTQASFATYSMQVAALDAAGPNGVIANPTPATPNLTPFGGFARAGDLLQVPFVGAYRIRPSTAAAVSASTVVAEMNSLSMDAAMTDCQDLGTTNGAALTVDQPQSTDATSTTAYPMREQIGRFCLVGDPIVTYGANNLPTPANAPTNMDFFPAIPITNLPNWNTNWRYRWASHLLEFVSPHTPQDDYLPDADPRTYFVQAGSSSTAPTPVAVANRRAAVANAQTAGVSEDTVPVEGLININTAPVPVLASVPWLPASTTASSATPYNSNGITNVSLAADIVAYRDQYGPFQSLFDLYKVPTFQKAAQDLAYYTQVTATTAAQQQAVGDYVSNSTTLNGPLRPPADFEKQFLLLNRVSNLLTTHSDSFTCYLLLQGYRGVATGNPTLVVQRRAAYLLDRTGVTPTNTQASVFPVPTN